MEVPVDEDGEYELEIFESEPCGGSGGPGSGGGAGCRGPSVKMRTTVDASAIVPPPGTTPGEPGGPTPGEPPGTGDGPPGPGDNLGSDLVFNPSTTQDPCCGTTESKIEVAITPLSDSPGPQ